MSEVFLKAVNMSISAGWLVLAVLALRLILKQAPKWVNVLLWGIVAVRLICPFSIESALSLIPSTETISPEIMMDWTPEISTGIAPLDQVVNPVISSSFAPNPGTSANPLQILIPVAANLWLLGVLILLAYTAISYMSLRHKLRTSVILRDNIFQCETVGSPFVLGILKPRIYLPYAMDGQNLHHVVAHEQAHIRRKDHWWKPLGFLLLTVYWFNPLMWVAYILLCRDIELACDEKVIAELGNDQRADYTQALVACAVNRRMIAVCPLAFGEVGVKDRIKSIMNYRKPTFWIIVTALVVCLVVAVCFLTDPIENDNADKNPDFFITSYLSNSQQTEIQKAYNRDNRAISVSVQFETTEGPTEINLIYSYKKNGVGNDWTYSDPVSLLLGESAMFTVPADHHFSFSATPLDGPNGNVQLVFTENKSLGNQTNQDEATPEKITFEAEVLEIHDGYFLVKPEPSWAINSADQIEVPMKNMDPALEPQVGDTIEIVCSGEILETYPARLSKVYGINVAKETSRLSLNDVIILSQYGYGLSWSDFDDFDYIETGSGLYIRVYEINDLFQLMIGGGSPDSDPMYIYLKSNDGSDDRIDIRDGGVTEFISEHNTVNINFTGNRNLGLNAEIIEVDSANHILYVKDIDKQDKVFGDRCAIDCSYAISRDNLIYVNYDDPNDVRTIEFDDFEIGDAIIIGMYDSEKEKAFNGSAIAEQIQLSTQKLNDENLIKKISKALELPAGCSLSYIGEYSDGSDVLLWFAIDGTYPDQYVAVECEKRSSGKYKFIDVYSPMTYAQDIVHVVWMAEDIFLVNNRACTQIVYMNEARETVQEIDVAEHGLPYIFRMSMPTNPGICMFIDANGEEIR